MNDIKDDDSQQFIARFFTSRGEVPIELQQDYAEAFQLRSKQTPEQNPKKFKAFILGLDDPVLKRFLENDAVVKPTARKSIGCLDKQTVVEKSEQPSPTSIPSTYSFSDVENIPLNLIFSLSEGVKSAIHTAGEIQQKYANTSFKTIRTLNPDIKVPNTIHASVNNMSLSVERYPKISNSSEYHFINSDSEVLSTVLGRRCNKICEYIMSDISSVEKTNNTELLSFLNIKNKDFEKMEIFIGRFIADSESGMTEHSTLLEMILSNGKISHLPAQVLLNQLKSYTVFPNQAVAIYGSSHEGATGLTIIPSAILSGVSIPRNIIPSKPSSSFNSLAQLSGMKIMCVAGPFCPTSGFDTTLLDKFINYAEQEKPHILIVLGPFVDVKNLVVKNCDPVIHISSTTLTEKMTNQSPLFLTNKDLYEVICNRLLMSPVLQKSTYIVIIPSVHDVSHPFPIPQPPIALCNLIRSTTPLKHIICPTNPGTIIIQDLIRISMTSADPVTPLLTSLLTKSHSVDERLTIIHSLLLKQLSFFPSHPIGIPINPIEFFEPPCLWSPDSLPHIIVYSSDKVVPGARIAENRVFINTGRLAGRGPSTLCQLYYNPEFTSTTNCVMDDTFQLDKHLRVDVLQLK